MRAPKYDSMYLLYMMTVPLSAIQMTARAQSATSAMDG